MSYEHSVTERNRYDDLCRAVDLECVAECEPNISAPRKGIKPTGRFIDVMPNELGLQHPTHPDKLPVRRAV